MIRSTSNKYGSGKKDRVRDNQSESVGSRKDIINTTVTLKASKNDSVTAGSFSKHLPKGRPINSGSGKLVATDEYGKSSYQA